ncbi:MAG: ABC transporter permease [Nitriliruptoraceae bacterium]|nr:ABC transporter permease [Nitriliruptoraceae bacterium]
MTTSPFRRLFNRPMTTVERFLVAIIVVYGTIVTLRAPQFLSLATLSDLLRGGSGIAILAIGVTIVLISGGIDVSFTAIAIVAGYSSVQLGRALEYDGLLLLTVGAIVIGALLGSINALLIHFFKLQTLIVTLATASVFHGTMALTLGMRTYTRADVPGSLIGFGEANVFTIQGEARPYGFTMFLPVVAGVVILTWFLLYRTRIGRSVFALGSNPESASRLGVNLLATQLFIYMYVGALSGLMGIIYFSRLAYINPAALVGSELAVIAIAVIGGAKLEGGEGTLLGTLLGVVIWQLFQNTLIFLGLGSQYNGLFFGSVLIFLLCVIYRRQRQINKRSLVFTT